MCVVVLFIIIWTSIEDPRVFIVLCMYLPIYLVNIIYLII